MLKFALGWFLVCWGRQEFRFVTVGACCAVFYNALFFVLYHVLGIDYKVSAWLAIPLNLALNFFGQKILTFTNHGYETWRRQVVYFVLKKSVFSLAYFGLLVLLVEWAALVPWVANGILTVAMGILSYFVMRKIFVHTPRR